ncbi:MAG: mevalonate kinase [Anaerolineales bacterium]
MPAISASAPGKVILFGEHAVVYGRPAIAVPVTQVQAKAIVTANPLGKPGEVRVQAPTIGLETTLGELPDADPLGVAIRGTLGEVGIARPPALTVRITSTIPVAAGLGSGAAVSVAVIRGLSAFLGHPLEAERVSALAYEVEKIHHGTPSGIDNTVVTYAMPVYFVRETSPGGDLSARIETFKVQEPFTLVIGDTGIPSPTAITVGDVRAARERDPLVYEAMFEAIERMVESAREAIESGHNEALGPLMDENQAVLAEIGVSSPELERLVEAARETGALGAKLSGGGRGGNMIALAPEEEAGQIARALEEAGAVRTIVSTVEKSR